jgi:hypothetical protein
MKTIILAVVLSGVMFAGGANGPKEKVVVKQRGILDAVSWPVRHPIKTVKGVVTSPLHPVKTTKAVFHFVAW